MPLRRTLQKTGATSHRPRDQPLRASQLKPRTASSVPSAAQMSTTARSERWSANGAPLTIAADRPVDEVRQRQRLRDVGHERGRRVGVVEDAADDDDRQEDRVDVRGGGVEVRDRVRQRDAERAEADDAGGDEDREHEPALRQPDVEQQRPRGDDERQLDRGVRDRVRGEPAEVGAARQRRAAQALEHALLAQEDHVHRERDERRRHDAHAGDAGHDDVEVRLARREDRAEQEQEQQRQQEVEERRARVAPEHLALEAVLAPGQGERAAHRRPLRREPPPAATASRGSTAASAVSSR